MGLEKGGVGHFNSMLLLTVSMVTAWKFRNPVIEQNKQMSGQLNQCLNPLRSRFLMCLKVLLLIVVWFGE